MTDAHEMIARCEQALSELRAVEQSVALSDILDRLELNEARQTPQSSRRGGRASVRPPARCCPSHTEPEPTGKAGLVVITGADAEMLLAFVRDGVDGARTGGVLKVARALGWTTKDVWAAARILQARGDLLVSTSATIFAATRVPARTAERTIGEISAVLGDVQVAAPGWSAGWDRSVIA